MNESGFKNILIIGEEPEELLKKYSKRTKVKPYLTMRRKNVSDVKKKHLKFLETLLKQEYEMLSDAEIDYYTDRYREISKMKTIGSPQTSEDDYYHMMTEGCVYSEETGDAYTTQNPYGKFSSYYLCEGSSNFVEPFQLLDGGTSFSVAKGEVDWSFMHNDKVRMALQKRTWELLVENDAPTDEAERRVKENWKNRIEYFSDFGTLEHYLSHMCSFWAFAVVSEEGYHCCDYKEDVLEWKKDFYNRWVADLPEETRLTLAEIRL